MLSNTLLTALLLLFSAQTTTALALPTRTHCQCKIVPDTPSSSSSSSSSSSTPTTSSPYAIDSPSAAHWAPASPSEDDSASPSPNPSASSTICSTLASQLSQSQHTHPDLYALYLQRAPTRSTDDAVANPPLATPSLASASGVKIVCYEDDSAPSALGDTPSPWTLVVLQLIVVLSIVACLAEGLHMLHSLRSRRSAADSLSAPNHSLRFVGAEKRLLAVPCSPAHTAPDAMASPGAEKKLRAYDEARGYLGAQAKSAPREFMAYEDDSDDEMNRPVL